MPLAEFHTEDVIRFTTGIDFEPPITVEEADIVARILNTTTQEPREIADAKFAIVHARETRLDEVDPRLVQLNSLVHLISLYREEQHFLNPHITSD